VLLLALVLGTFALAPLVGWVARSRAAAAVALLPAGLFAAFLAQLPIVAAGGLTEVRSWIPTLGIAARFRLDGLSLLFALLITGIGAVVFLYAARYFRQNDKAVRFFITLTVFAGAMLGAVLADDLILLIVFWELTSLTSFFLIGFYPESADARRSAQQGLLVTVAGGLALLAGGLILGTIGGTFSISELIANRAVLAEHALAPVVIGLVALGAFTKSAQFPFHFWLPNAMVAPTPVSAYLHSATMVKLGVYLLARFDPVFGQSTLWIGLLVTVGTLTMLVGSMHALRNTDLKRLLAYSTVVSLGTLVVLIGNPAPMASVALALFLVGHALYKACLFLVTGIIDYRAGSRDSAALGGLRHRMPITAAVAVLGALSMAGLPPFVGFLAKEVLYEATLLGRFGWVLAGIGVLTNAVMVVVAGAVALRCFFGPLRPTPREPRDPSVMMWGGPALLALLGVLFGILPELAGNTVVAAAAEAAAGAPVPYSLALWHGLSVMLLLSAVTLALGVGLYRGWPRIQRALAAADWIDRHGLDGGYDRALHGLQRVAAWQTSRLQHGSLRGYLWATLAVFTVGVGGALLLGGGVAWPGGPPEGLGPVVVLPILLVITALAVGMAPNFVAGLVAAGVVGFVVAVIYLFQGAPDLAFTQFLVEALAVVILLAIVRFLPFREPEFRTPAERRNDAALAAGFGAVVTVVLLAVVSGAFDPQVSDFFRQASQPEAHGRNLVNVIIVDFRGIDTLGEIMVLSLAAIAAAAVVKSVRRPGQGER